MTTYLIQTLGSRDVKIDNQALKEKLTPPREIFDKNNHLYAREGGQFLLDHFDQVKKLCDAPMVRPALEYILQKEPEITGAYLILTDQDPNIAGGFYSRDSVNYGMFIEKWIKTFYEKKVKEITLIKVDKDVTYLDQMYQFWSKKLRSKPFNKISDASRVYLCNQGGIDAINTAVMLNGINRFGANMVLLNVNEKTGVAASLDFPDQFRQEQIRQEVKALLEHYHYASLGDFEIPEAAKMWACFAHSRLSFDFEKAQEILADMPKEEYSLRDSFLETINNLTSKNAAFLMEELIKNAELKLFQGEYVDFLSRMFRLREELAKNEGLNALKKEGFEIEDLKKWDKNFKAFLHEPGQTKLKDFLDHYKTPEGSALNYLKTPPNIPIFEAILEYFYSKDEELLWLLKQFGDLAGLRNKSIAAHGFEGVSRRDMENVLEISVEELVKHLKKYLNVKENPFNEINKIIKNRI